MNLVGNPKNLKIIDRAYETKKVSHAYLFVGPKYVGKTQFGLYFAKKLLCTGDKKPCDQCASCRMLTTNNHPDFIVNDNTLPVGIDEVRELIRFLEMKPYQSKVKVALISHFERLSHQAANAFLKTLEEPAKNTFLILTTENTNNLLPTIKSRSQIIRFGRIPKEDIINYVMATMRVGRDDAEAAYAIGGGALGLMTELLGNPEKMTKVTDLLKSFEDATDSENLRDKIVFAENIAKDKANLYENLDYMEIYSRAKLHKGNELLKNCHLLDKIAKSKEYLRSNANPRLVIEDMLI